MDTMCFINNYCCRPPQNFLPSTLSTVERLYQLQAPATNRSNCNDVLTSSKILEFLAIVSLLIAIAFKPFACAWATYISLLKADGQIEFADSLDPSLILKGAVHHDSLRVPKPC
jgi:hypothetical protein